MLHEGPAAAHQLRALRELAEAGLELQPPTPAMTRDVRSWDEMEEAGLRLCAENPMSVSMPAQVTACCWDPNNPGMVGLCGVDGSFVVLQRELEADTVAGSYAVYFNTLPVHLWGRRGEDGARHLPPIASAPARRLDHAWSQVTFVPGHAGELLFVQGWSNRVLLTSLPKVKPRQFASARSNSSGDAAGGRFGLLDGSRVVALDGHEAQVRCLAIDSRGVLLLSGDESGTMCARLLHRGGDGGHRSSHHGSAYPSERPVGEGALEVDIAAKVVRRAHEGGVLAVSHVEGSFRLADGDTGGSSALFISGGEGGVVRLWRATALLERRKDNPHADHVNVELHVQLLTDMLVGGFQVSCLASSLSYRAPLVLAGTTEGTVFAFRLRDPSSTGEGTPGTDSRTESDVRDNAAHPADGHAELGVVVMKFEHTRRSIERVTCSREQELIAVADADGIIRTYRPLSSRADSPDVVEERQPSQRDAEDGAASGAAPRPFELVVECRLGARPALCDFASEGKLAGDEHSHRHGGGDGEREEEVLRTCTREGNLRIWPTTSLPTHPIRPPSAQSPPAAVAAAAAPDEAPAGKTQASRLDTDRYGRPVADARDDQENRDPSDPFSRWATTEPKGRRDPEGGEALGEEPIARGEAPLPGVRPAAPRHVSFAPAEQVYRLQESYYSTDQEMEDDEEEDYDGDFELPRPPPPAPTPAPHSAATGPRRLRQTWGGATRGSRGRALDGVGAGGDSSVFVPPSKLQEASLWSTAMEQAALERRMREEFDAGAVQEPAGAGSRAAAASVVNIPPRARTFEGLVPVSLDAPPPRPKRKGKQVSKEHLSKVQQQRITEEDLLFDGMEPSFSSMAQFGSSGMWPHAELEWYGGRAAFADIEDASVVSDRVWSLGRRP